MISNVAADIFIAELMVESNVTLEARTIMAALNETGDITVKDTNEVSHKVTFLEHQLIAGVVSFLVTPSCEKSLTHSQRHNLLH